MIRVAQKDRIFDTLRDTQRAYLSMKISFKIRTDVVTRKIEAAIQRLLLLFEFSPFTIQLYPHILLPP